ncbi:ATP-binding protein [Actinophytocola sp. NPDC049390]|uniref:ATP-binding protein n=1 Tax=Actinophytocola sp. NPDC049390 TaxID=3363894 RepID=UPI00379E75D2
MPSTFEPDPEAVADLAGLAGALDALRRRAARGTGKNRVSLHDLARMTGLPRSTVHTYVSGKALPAVDVLDRVVMALGVPPEELAAWSEAWYRVSAGRERRRDAAPSYVPRQLPPDVPGFVGRHDKLVALDGLLPGPSGTTSTSVIVSAIAGTAGVGKTALAVHWARRVADGFPDGQLHLNLRGYDVEAPMRPEEALGRLLRALGVAVADLPAARDERAALFRSVVAGKRYLVLLDNARSSEQVRDLLPGEPGCLTVITSRDALTGLVARDGARRVDLDLLPLADAVALVRLMIGERVGDEPAAAAELAQACARLPLALRVAGEYVRSRPGVTLADAVAELRDERRRLSVLDADGDDRTAIRAVFSWSYRALADGPARLFRLLGAHPGTDVDLYAAAALVGSDLATTTALLDELVRANLVTSAGVGRHTMHDLLTGYALDLTGHERPAEPLQRLLRYYSYAAMVAMDTLYPAETDRRPRIEPPEGTAVPDLGTSGQARVWLETERANLLAMVRLAGERGWTRWIGELAGTLWRELDAQSHTEDALAMHHLALSVAEASGDVAAQADALRNLSTVYRAAGHYTESLDYAERCVALRHRLGDEKGEAAAHNSVGIVAGLLGRMDDAVAAYQRSLALRRATGDVRGEAAVLLNLAVTTMRTDVLDGTEEHLTRAQALFREIGDRLGEGHALNNLGGLYRALGRYDTAREHHEQALAVYREIGARDGHVDAMNGIAQDLAGAGRFAEALGYFEQALELGDNGHHGILNDIHNSMGETLIGLGRLREARHHHETARTLATNAGDRLEQARALAGIAQTLADEDPAGARQLWTSALALYEDLRLPQAEHVRARLAANEHRVPC